MQTIIQHDLHLRPNHGVDQCRVVNAARRNRSDEMPSDFQARHDISPQNLRLLRHAEIHVHDINQTNESPVQVGHIHIAFERDNIVAQGRHVAQILLVQARKLHGVDDTAWPDDVRQVRSGRGTGSAQQQNPHPRTNVQTTQTVYNRSRQVVSTRFPDSVLDKSVFGLEKKLVQNRQIDP